jgi:hypothetical protein
MTKVLEEAIATLRTLPESEQDRAATFLLAFADPDGRDCQLDDAQAAEVEEARREVGEGTSPTPGVWVG